MAEEKRKDEKPADARKGEEGSKGQYGGLRNLGPGGGSEPEDAVLPDGADRAKE
jgi:hypothetical protein